MLRLLLRVYCYKALGYVLLVCILFFGVHVSFAGNAKNRISARAMIELKHLQRLVLRMYTAQGPAKAPVVTVSVQLRIPHRWCRAPGFRFFRYRAESVEFYAVRLTPKALPEPLTWKPYFKHIPN